MPAGAAQLPGSTGGAGVAKTNARDLTGRFFYGAPDDRRTPGRAHRLLITGVMRVLEARFHPRRRGQADFVTLGYLVWRDEHDDERPVFEPARALVPDAVRSKLEYLVGVNEPDSFARLQALRSVYWSFVPITTGEART
jgi:hypothetical protein